MRRWPGYRIWGVDHMSKRRGGPAEHTSGGMLRIAMLGKGWFPDELGGLDRYFTSLYQSLRAIQSVRPTALVIGPATGAPVEVNAVVRHEDMLVRRLLAVVRRARSIDADVVDVHFALYAVLPIRISRLRRLPLVVHFQGPWADESSVTGGQSPLRVWAKRRIERSVYRRATRCIVLTNAFKRVLIERYRVSPWHVVVEPPGVDLAQFSPGERGAARASLAIPDRAFVACCVRRLVPRMGIDVLLDAWSTVAARLDHEALLLVAGDGPLKAELEARVAELGLDGAVRFLGRVSDEVLVQLYRAADVNVVPTVAHEGFGLIVLEAAACGTPSVVTRNGGLPEAVRGLDPSLAVEAASPDALADRLLGQLPSSAEALAFASGHAWPEVAARNLAHFDAVTKEVPLAKLRVVYLDHTAQMSGGEIALLRLLPHLANVEPHVVLAEDGPFADALTAEGISVEVVQMPARARETRKGSVRLGRLSPLAVAASVVYTLRIARRLHVLSPDLVHTNSLKAGVYGAIATRIVGIPVIWHVRDRIADDYLPASAAWFVRSLIRHLANFVIVNSHATLLTLGGAIRAEVVHSVVPEVVSLDRPLEVRGAGTESVFGIIGRLAPWKGQDVFLEAFARAFPVGKQSAVIVGAPLFGEEEKQYASGLLELARELGIADRVEFRGFRSDVWGELARMDVLVHASTIPEPFGQVILEGMVSGIAVVASAEGGPLELITPSVDGELYPPGDVERLAAILRELDSDPKRRRRLGEAARVRARDFLPGPTAVRVESIYHTILRERARHANPRDRGGGAVCDARR